MRFTYSPTADALAAEFAEGRTARMVELGPGIHADLDARGRLLAIEILNASGHYARAELEQIASPVELITIPEAVKDSGLEASTLRRQLGAGKIKGAVKRGSDWLIPRHELWNYLEGRTGVGRPPGSAKGQAVRHQTIRFPARAPATVGKIVIVEHDADPAPLKRAAKRATGGGRRKVKP